MDAQTKIFTVDVEEYFHAENILNSIPREKLAKLESRIHIGTRKILDLLAEHGSTATFFVLGCVAEKHPGLIKEISDAGHEVASHGYSHIPLHKHTPGSFLDDIERSIEILSGITGKDITGYRATSFSVAPGMGWFFEILKKSGIIYDSSLAPSVFRKYHRDLWVDILDSQKDLGIMEFPPSYVSMGPVRLPMGGGYFRVYPLSLTRYGLERPIAQRRTPPLFYIHPWELDPSQPREKVPLMEYVRHYIGLSGTERKLSLLLKSHKFISIKDFLEKGTSGTQDK